LLERLANLDAVSLEGPLVCVSGYNVALTAEQRDLYQMLLSSVVASKWDGVSVGGLHKQFPQAEVTALMKLIESSGQIHLVSDVGWVSVANTAALQSLLQGWFSDNEEITPSDFKELTSLTRKRAIPFLEWSDQQRWTRRRGNLRMQGDKLFSR
jgi:selenocysteine-specific elongation factor